MTGVMIILVIVALAAIGWIVARARATRLQAEAGRLATNSLPSQHGWYVALWTAVPALIWRGNAKSLRSPRKP